jgi:hypothetical protein
VDVNLNIDFVTDSESSENRNVKSSVKVIKKKKKKKKLKEDENTNNQINSTGELDNSKADIHSNMIIGNNGFTIGDSNTENRSLVIEPFASCPSSVEINSIFL